MKCEKHPNVLMGSDGMGSLYCVPCLLADAERLRAERDAVRKPVRWFAEQMERKLKANDYKEHWSECEDEWLIERLGDECAELHRAYRSNRLPSNRAKQQQCIIDEAADVANFAMMIADKARAALAEKD